MSTKSGNVHIHIALSGNLRASAKNYAQLNQRREVSLDKTNPR